MIEKINKSAFFLPPRENSTGAFLVDPGAVGRHRLSGGAGAFKKPGSLPRRNDSLYRLETASSFQLGHVL